MICLESPTSGWTKLKIYAEFIWSWDLNCFRYCIVMLIVCDIGGTSLHIPWLRCHGLYWYQQSGSVFNGCPEFLFHAGWCFITACTILDVSILWTCNIPCFLYFIYPKTVGGFKFFQNIIHETAVCCNPLIHSFTADRKNLTDSWRTNI
jgi:hypothetical protein